MAKNTMSAKAQQIMDRYKQSYVTDVQLSRYLQLGAITDEEYEVIYAIRHPARNVGEQPVGKSE